MKCTICGDEQNDAVAVCPQCGSQPSVSPTASEDAASAPTLTIRAPSTSWMLSSSHARGSAAESEFDRGAAVAGRYRVLERVGTGGMGAVYKVLDLELNRTVALKTIRAEMAGNAHALAMFKKELILARQVTHKNVCRVFDLGHDRDVRFLTMEYVEGRSLGHALKKGEKFTPTQAAEIMLQVAEGLDAAHETGIVHRDLKPDNIMLGNDGRVLVMDFGIARPVEESGSGFAGTPRYAAPEQILGQAQDRRSDVFSFGLILYELLCGEAPYSTPDTMEKLRERAALAPPPMMERDPAIPKELGGIVDRCLALRPDQRFAGAHELATALRNWLHPKPFYAKSAFTASLGAAVLVSIGAVIWSYRTPPPPPPLMSLLVADFENRTGDPVFDGTFEPALQTALEGASFITAYDRGAAKRLVTQLRPGSAGLDAEGARLVAGREGIAAVVSGAIERQGTRYQLTLRTTNPSDGKELVPPQRESAGRDQVLAAVGRLAAPVRRALGDTTPVSEQVAAAETFTAASLEAANRYSAAHEFQYVGRRDQALQAYQDAIRLDPNMGRAYAGLAVVNRNLNRPAEALQNYELALSHIGRMSEREKLRTPGRLLHHRQQSR